MSLKDVSALPNYIYYIENYHEAAAIQENISPNPGIIKRLGGWIWVIVAGAITFLCGIINIMQGKAQLITLKALIISVFQ